MPTPLERPALPHVDAPVSWPHAFVIAVFGPGEARFARALADARPGAALLTVALRHAPGFELRDGAIFAHPSALTAALEASDPHAGVVVGVGGPFAVAVRADLVVWIADGQPAVSLPPPLRTPARRAALVIEEAREGVAAALGAALRARAA